MEEKRNWKIYRNKRGWPRWFQPYLEAWWIIRGKWSLHKAWQDGLDLGHRQEWERVIENMGDIDAQRRNVEKADKNIAAHNLRRVELEGVGDNNGFYEYSPNSNAQAGTPSQNITIKEWRLNMEFTKTEIVLGQLRRYVAQYLSPELTEGFRMEVRDMVEMLGKQVVLLVDLPKEPLKVVEGLSRFEFPLTWFDHLRNSHFPRFLTGRWPIRYKTHETPYKVEVGAVYPKLPMAFPKYGGDIRFYDIKSNNTGTIRNVGEEWND